MARQLPSTPPASFQISAIPPRTLQAIRMNGVDEYANPLNTVTQKDAPLRCCLRDATDGEPIAVIAYCPFPWSSPYAEVGPVFIHAEPCAGYDARALYPEGFRRRRQIFRAYGYDRKIVHAQIIDGIDADPAIADLFRRADVDFVHSRNVEWGCFMFEIRRV